MKEKRISMKSYMPIAFYFSFMAAFIFKDFQSNLFSDFDFKRQVGRAAFSNYDVDSGIQCLLFLLLIVLPVSFAVSIAIFQKIGQLYASKNDNFQIVKEINIFIFCAFIPFTFEVFGKFGTDEPLNPIYVHLLVVFLSCYIYLIVRSKADLSCEDLKWNVGLSVSLSWIFKMMVSGMGIQIPICIFYIGIFFINIKILNDARDPKRIKAAAVPFFFLMFFYALALEGIVVFNQHGVITGHIMIWMASIFLIFILASVVIFCVEVPVEPSGWINWGMLLSFILWSGLPPVQMENVMVEFFEQANKAVPFSQTFLFHKIPYIEHVSAHLASDWIPNFLYYILNGDYQGALVPPYVNLVAKLNCIVLYCILKKCMKKDYALFVCLFMPSSYFEFWGSMGLISVAAVAVIYREKASLRNYVLFWVLLALSVLYRADFGIALGFGVVLAYLSVCLLEKRKLYGKELALSFISVTSCLGMLYVGLCIIKGIQPLSRIKEFLSIFGGSNEIWSYGKILVQERMQFTIVYFILPVIILLLMFVLAYGIWKRKITGGIFCKTAVFTFGFSYFINMQRIIVRHNLSELGFSVGLTFTAAIFIALALDLMAVKYKIYMFLSVLGVFFLLFHINAQTLANNSLLHMAYENYDEGKVIYDYDLEEKINRVILHTQTVNAYENVVNELNSLLAEGETFYDFSNQSLLYSIARRENPVYTAQTLGLVSGDFVQDCFIKELSDKNMPIAISAISEELNCGIGIDGFCHSYREYKLSEYLNQNYIPVETVDGFAIWVRKDRKDLLAQIKEQYAQVDLQKSFGSNHLSVQKTTNGYTLRADGLDPHVDDIAIKEMDSCTISIKYKSSIEGSLQIFYKSTMDENYTEEHSVTVPIGFDGTAIFDIHEPVRYIRLDIPESCILQIDSIYCRNAGYALCFYDYGQKDQLHYYDLGYIPYLWGTRDYKKAYENQVLYRWDTIGDGQEICFDKQIPYDSESVYMKIDLFMGDLGDLLEKSDVSYAEIVLGSDTDGFTEKIRYKFDLSKGTCSYLIRLSADSYWANRDIQKAFLYLPKMCVIDGVELLEGD